MSGDATLTFMVITAALPPEASDQLITVALAEVIGEPLNWSEVSRSDVRDLCEGRDGCAVLSAVGRGVISVMVRAQRRSA